MIYKGANPYVIDAKGESNYRKFNLANQNLTLDSKSDTKSVFYPIKTFGNLGEPWCYTTGVFDGKFGRVVGKGGEGIVIKGEWKNEPAAYKFVQIKKIRFADNYEKSMADMSERLKEMTEMTTTPGDSILPFRAHFR